MAEVLSKRTGYQKVFDDPPGENQFRAEIHAGEIHYLDDADAFQDVDGLMDAATFRSKDKRVQFGITNGYIGSWLPGGPHLGFRPWKIAYYDSASGKRKALEDADYSNATLTGNLGTISDVYPGSIDLQVQFAPRRMRKRYRLPSLPNLPDPSQPSIGMDPATTYLVFGYEVDNASNLTFHRGDTDEPFPLDTPVHADIVMKDAQGDERLGLMEGKAVSDGGRFYPVYYLRTAQIPFGECISYSDLQIAHYPLIIDPSATIYGGTGYGEIEDNGSTKTVDTPAYIRIGVDEASKTYYTARQYERFDLSSYSGNTCDSADLELYKSGTSGAASSVYAYLHDTDWGSTLEAGDWGASSTLQPGSIASTATTGWNTLALDEDDVGAKFGSWAAFELKNSDETSDADKFVTIRATDSATEPYLDITYTEGASATSLPPFARDLMVSRNTLLRR